MNITDKIAEQVQSGEIVADEATDTEGYTGYGVWKVLAETFTAVGIERNVTPQYVYNLIKSGTLDGVKGSATGRRFTEDQVATFVEKMVRRNLGR